jgi:predicted dehydrogenase
MDTIRTAVVGLGGRGLGWIGILNRMSGYRVVAVCDPIEPLRRRALAQFERPSTIRSYAAYADALADPEVDAIALTVRCREQGAMAAQALEAGKHCHAEVPAAHRIEDCWRIVLASERTGRVYHLAEQTRYWGFVDVWRDLVASGRLGHVTLCEGQYFHYLPELLYQDPSTGRHFRPVDVEGNPDARPTWLCEMPPIHYLPHELSPMLRVLDDRVVDVTAMSTARRSYTHPNVPQADMQVALMKTEKDAILRMAASFWQPHPPRRDLHWYQVVGTRGCVEWRRTPEDPGRVWTLDSDAMTAADWRFARDDAPDEARGSGHGDADYYVHAAFRDAVLYGKKPEFDVYRAMDTAAPAILAAESIAQGSRPMRVPDFRPNASRPVGQEPRPS